MARQCCIALMMIFLIHLNVQAMAQDPPNIKTKKSEESVRNTNSPNAASKNESKSASKKAATFPRITRPDSYWRKHLSQGQYYVARKKGTETAFSGIYWDHHEDGIYTCVCCGTPLFDSEAKFDSGTGWPSFWQVLSKNFLKIRPDTSGGQIRTEVNCKVCDAHMGHVFDDGPRPTGLRFCINSASIRFVPRKKTAEYLDQWREQMGLPPLEPVKSADGNEKSKSSDPISPTEK